MLCHARNANHVGVGEVILSLLLLLLLFFMTGHQTLRQDQTLDQQVHPYHGQTNGRGNKASHGYHHTGGQGQETTTHGRTGNEETGLEHGGEHPRGMGGALLLLGSGGPG